MTASIEVIQATAKHTPLLARLHAEIFLDEAWPESWFVQRLKKPNTTAFLATLNRQPAGLAVLASVLDEAEILTLGVSPACRNSGIGKSILSEIISVSVRYIFLEVAEDNLAALALYQSAGFVENGRRPNYYSSGMDAILMMYGKN